VNFFALFLSTMYTCRRVRLLARRGAIPEALGRYAISLEAALASFAIGGAFVSFHYCEMLWHFFALTMALEVVAAKEALAITTEAARPKQQSASVTTQPLEPDFVWG